MGFGNLINLGVKSEMDFYQKHEVKVINLLTLIVLFTLFIGTLIMFFITGTYPFLSVIFSAIPFLLILGLNKRSYHNAAIYLFVIVLNLSVFLVNQQYQYSVGNYLYYFPLIFCVALFHNPYQSKVRTFVFFGIILVSFLASEFIDIKSLKLTYLTETDNKNLFTYNSVLTIFLSIVIVYFVVKFTNRQNKDAMALLKKEQESQKIISQSLKEKEILLAEIQHRVKNNLAIIAGLLNLQTEKAPCEVSKQLMLESRNRVMSIAMVHDRLYKKDNLSKIDLKLYLSELVNEVVKSFPIKAKQIEIQEELDKVEIEITKAVPVGLIINEALTNSLKHAFKEGTEKPIIKIKMQAIYDRIQICLLDNGHGFSDIKNREDTALGLSLIESLADQIDANVVFKNENGACVSLVIPV